MIWGDLFQDNPLVTHPAEDFPTIPAKCSEFWYSNRPIWSCKLVIKVSTKKKRAWCVMIGSRHKNLPWSRQLFILSVPLCPTAHVSKKASPEPSTAPRATIRIRPFGRRNLSGVIDVEEVEIIPCSSDSRGDGYGSGHPGEWRQVFFGEVLNWGIPKTKGFDTKWGHPHFRKALYIFYMFGNHL